MSVPTHAYTHVHSSNTCTASALAISNTHSHTHAGVAVGLGPTRGTTTLSHHKRAHTYTHTPHPHIHTHLIHTHTHLAHTHTSSTHTHARHLLRCNDLTAPACPTYPSAPQLKPKRQNTTRAPNMRAPFLPSCLPELPCTTHTHTQQLLRLPRNPGGDTPLRFLCITGACSSRAHPCTQRRQAAAGAAVTARGVSEATQRRSLRVRTANCVVSKQLPVSRARV
jgi:hypothetical protein